VPDALNPKIKSLNYLNNIIAKIKVNRAGVAEALLLNGDGYVAEGTGDNIFRMMPCTYIRRFNYSPPTLTLGGGSLQVISGSQFRTNESCPASPSTMPANCWLTAALRMFSTALWSTGAAYRILEPIPHKVGRGGRNGWWNGLTWIGWKRRSEG
jgi:hypothetical protein